MVEIQGNASTGYVYNDTGPLDLPRDTSTIRAAHQPWCVDCKRKGRELDVDQRCPQCARAVITRAEGAARRAAAEQAAAEQAAEIRAKRTTTPTKLPTEGKQGKPTTRSSAPRAIQTSDVPDRGRTPGRAPGAGSSTHREKNPPTVQETRPATVGGLSSPVENRQADTSTPTPPTAAQILDAQIAHASELLRATASHPHPAVQAERAAVVAALEALHLLVELTPTAAPAPAAAPSRSAIPAHDRPDPRRIQLPVDEVIEAYNAGKTLDDIAHEHGCSAPTVRRLLVEHDVPRRGAPVPRSPELIEQIRRLYVDEHLSQAEVAQRLGTSTKVVQNVMAEAGIDRRASKARTARDNAIGLKKQIADLGVTSADIKAWAIAAGHLTHIHRGLPARALVEKYAAAHREDVVA